MTIETDKLDEKFESSFDVNANLPDAVTKGSNKRPADKTEGEKESKKLTKAQMISGISHASYKLSHPELTAKYREFFAMQGQNVSDVANRATIKAGGLKEDVASLFEGTDLSEEFKDNATTIFEAAVSNAIVVETARLEEEFEERLEEQVSEIMESLSDNIAKYMDYVAEQWLEENALAVESGLRADITESFMAGLKSLFVENYVDVPEDKVDVVESLADEVERLRAELNESENRTIEMQKQIDEATAASVLATVSEGLTESQRDKLATLAESVEFVDAESYTTKLKTIAEGYVARKPAANAVEQLNEELDMDDNKKSAVVSDPLVAAAVASLGKKR